MTKRLGILAVLIFAFISSGCLIELWGLYEAVKPEEENKVEIPGTKPVLIITDVFTANLTVDLTVDVTFTLKDDNGDAVDVTVEYSTDGLNYNPVTTITTASAGTIIGNVIAGIPCNTSPQTRTFTWDAADDGFSTSDATTGITLRLTPDDLGNGGVGDAQVSGSIILGNGPPVIVVDTPSGSQSGIVVVTYYLFDSTDDPCSISPATTPAGAVEFSIDGGTTWNPATLGAGETENLTSNAVGDGEQHDFVWNTLVDIPSARETSVRIRITPADTEVGTSGSTGLFEVNNLGEKVVALFSVIERAKVSPIVAEYSLFDTQNDLVDVVLEFSLDGTTWFAATPYDGSEPTTGRTSSPTGTPHTFLWDYASTTGPENTEIINPMYNNVILRITPSDKDGSGNTVNSDAFTIGNEAPVVSITSPSGGFTYSGAVTVQYTITDSSSDISSISVEYDSGSGFNPATITVGELTALTSDPAGVAHTFTWNSQADIGAALNNAVVLRITGLDPEDGLNGIPDSTAAFTIDNESALPFASVKDLDRIQTSPAVIEFTLYDSDSDPCDVTIQFSEDGGVGWADITQEIGFELVLTGMTSSPTGTLYQAYWDCSAVLSGTSWQDDCQVKITAQDADGSTGDITSNVFIMGNQQCTANIYDKDPLQVYSGNIILTFELTDPDADPCDVVLEYSTAGAVPVYTPIPAADITGVTTSLSSGVAPVLHSVVWDTLSTLGTTEYAGLIKVRAVPSDRDAGVNDETSGVFTIDNSGENPVVNISTISRISNTTSATIGFTLYDKSSDDVDIYVEYSVEGGAWTACELTGEASDGVLQTLSSSPSGVFQTLEWNWPIDLGAGSTDDVYSPVRIRITPTDSMAGDTVESNDFMLGNTKPSVEITTPTDRLSGNAVINFTLYDLVDDATDIYVQVANNTQITGAGLTPSGPNYVAALSGDIAPYSVTVYDGTYPVLFDDGSGNLVDRTGSTTAFSDGAPLGTVNYATGDISVEFESAPAGAVTADYAYRDGTWADASVITGVTALDTEEFPVGVDHALIIDLPATASYFSTGYYVSNIRITPTDSFGLAGDPVDSGSVYIGKVSNRNAVNIASIARAKTSPASISCTIIDPDSDDAAVDIEYSVDGGASWQSCTVAAGSDPVAGLTAAPSGRTYSYLWDFATDLDMITVPMRTGVLTRISPSDNDGYGEAEISQPFIIGNEAPAATISYPALGNTVSGQVTVTYILSDSSSDNADITVEVDEGSGYNPATVLSGGTEDLATSVSGITHTFTWDSLADITNPVTTPVTLRITPSDPDDGKTGSGGVSANFTVDNSGDVPNVSIVDMDTILSDPGQIQFRLYDQTSDACTVTVKYSTTGIGGVYTDVLQTAPAVPLTGLASSPTGTLHTLSWDVNTPGLVTGAVLTDCFIEIIVSDDDGTQSAVYSNQFRISNTEPDAVLADFNPAPAYYSGVLTVEFTVTDPEDDDCDVLIEYASDGLGGTYSTIPSGHILSGVTSGLSSASGSNTHTITWDTVATLGYTTGANYAIRITASDRDTDSTPDEIANVFTIDNTLTLPLALIVDFPDRIADLDQVTVSYSLFDPDSDAVDVLVQYSVNAAAYVDCTAQGGDGVSGLTSSPTGTSHTFIWDWNADLNSNFVHSNVKIRVIPSQTPGGTGTLDESNTFLLGNRTPSLEITDPSGTVTEDIILEFDLFDSTQDYTDIEVKYEQNAIKNNEFLFTGAAAAPYSGSFGGSIVAEPIGRGDGATNTFTGTLVRAPLDAGTLTITCTSGAATLTVTDDGAGALIGDIGAGTNTIDYATGAFDVTFSGNSDNLTFVFASYTPTNTEVAPGSVIISWSGSNQLFDDGVGNLEDGGGIDRGDIDYTTGDYVITQEPGVVDVYASYIYNIGKPVAATVLTQTSALQTNVYPVGVQHALVWDSVADLGYRHYSSRLWIRPTDEHGAVGQWVRSGSIYIDNTGEIMYIELLDEIDSVADGAGYVPIRVKIYDQQSNLADVNIEYSLNGAAWVASGSESSHTNLTSSPDGEEHTIYWNPSNPAIVSGDVLTQGDGLIQSWATLSFTKTDVKPNTVTVHATVGTAGVNLVDDGIGGLSGDGYTGTIDYVNGQISVDFSPDAPDNGTDITADYTSGETSLTNWAPTAGDGLTTYFEGPMDNDNITPGTVIVRTYIGAALVTLTDDGVGNLTDGTHNGTVEYTTGNITLTFATAPDNGADIEFDYDYGYRSGGDFLAQGDGATLGFSGILKSAVADSDTLRIHAVVSGSPVTLVDTGGGVLSDGTHGGTVNYATGAYTLTFVTNAPDAGTAVTADYTSQGDGLTAGQVYLRLTPYDQGATADGIAVISNQFYYGNTAPTVESVTDPTGRQVGNVTLTFEVSDTESDLVDIQMYYSTDGSTWFACSIAETLLDLATTPAGVSYDRTWDSAADLNGVYSTTVQFRVIATDENGAVSGTVDSGQFTVDNNTPAECVFRTAIGRQFTGGSVNLPVTITDAEDLLADLKIEYTDDGGTTWYDCTLTGQASAGVMDDLTASAGGTDDDIEWLSPAGPIYVQVRITPDDNNPGGFLYPGTVVYSDSFWVGNTAPGVTISSPTDTSTVSGDVVFSYTLTDSESDSCDLTFRYSTDNWATDFACSTSDSLTGITPGTHTLTWNSETDIPNYEGDVEVRITADDSALTGFDEANDLIVDNRDKAECDLTLVNADLIGVDENGDVTLRIILKDTESDTIDLTVGSTDNLIEYSPDNGTNWYECDIQQAIDSLASSPAGVQHDLTWRTANEPLAEFPNFYSIQVLVRVTPYDGQYGNVATMSGTFTVDNNVPPSVSNAAGPSRQAVLGDVTITYDLADTEGDLCGVDVYYTTNGWGSEALCTMGTGGSGDANLSPGSLTYVWKAGTDLAPGEYNVEIRIEPHDNFPSSETGTTDTSAAFWLGNYAPTAAITAPTTVPPGPISGDLVITYTLTDSASDTCSIEVRYSVDGTNYYIATTTGALNSLASSPGGTSHTITWNSASDISGYEGDVDIRIKPSDTQTGAEDTWTGYEVNNNNAPVIVLDESTLTGELAGNITVSFNVSDAESDNVDISIQYSVDGTNWYDCDIAETLTGLATTAGGVDYDRTWDSTTAANIPDEYSTTVKVRVQANDGLLDSGWDTHTGTFAVDNNDPPVITNIANIPRTPAWGDVTITFDMSDDVPIASSCSVNLEYSTDGGGTWLAGTETFGHTNITPGTALTMTWDADGDLGGLGSFNVIVRMTPYDNKDSGDVGTSLDSNAFWIGNTAPSVSITDPSDTDLIGGNKIFSYTLSDTEGDACDITFMYSIDNGTGWTDCATSGSKIGLTPGPLTITWNSVTDIPSQEPDVEVRIVPSDTAAGTEDQVNDLEVNNNANPPVITISPIQSTALSTVKILYNIADPDAGDESDVTVEYSLDGGGSFLACSPYSGYNNPESAVTDGDHLFVWDANSDLSDFTVRSIVIKVTAVDTGAKTGSDTETLDYGNTLGTCSVQGIAQLDGADEVGITVVLLGRSPIVLTPGDPVALGDDPRGYFYFHRVRYPAQDGELVVRAYYDFGGGYINYVDFYQTISNQGTAENLTLDVQTPSAVIQATPSDLTGTSGLNAWAMGGDSIPLTIKNNGTGLMGWDISCDTPGIVVFSKLSGILYAQGQETIRLSTAPGVDASVSGAIVKIINATGSEVEINLDINYMSSIDLATYFDGTEDFLTASAEIYGYLNYTYSGSGLAIADMNRNGWSELLIGNKGVSTDAGSISVFDGTFATRYVSQSLINADWEIAGSTAEALGSSMCTGDFNGDGYPDIAVGAPEYGGTDNTGRIYILYGHSNYYALEDFIHYIEGDLQTNLPTALASGDWNGDGFDDLGAVTNTATTTSRFYVFHGSVAGITANSASECDTCIEEHVALMAIGAVDNAGDITGNGFDDILIGASKYRDLPKLDMGAAFIFEGSASGISGTLTSDATITLTGDISKRRFGISVLGLGDRDNNGTPDIAIGASENLMVAPEGDGGIYIWHGEGGIASGDLTTSDIEIDGWLDSAGAPVFSSFGKMLVKGDFDGDSYIDMVTSSTDSGAFMGRGSSAIGLKPSAWFQEWGNSNNGALGSAAAAGDIDGDGFDDLIISDASNSEYGTYTGSSFLRYGTQFGKGTWINPSITAVGYDTPVASAGDFNGDGYPDIIVGDSENSDLETSSGIAYIYYGSATGPRFNNPNHPSGADVVLYPVVGTEKNLKEHYFGSTVIGVGDWDGDGYDDVAVGAMGAYASPAPIGTVYLFFGAPEGFDGYFKLDSSGFAGTAQLGGGNLAVGDLNNDGLPDLAAISFNYNEGWFYGFFSAGDRILDETRGAIGAITNYTVIDVRIVPNSAGYDYLLVGGDHTLGSFGVLLEFDGVDLFDLHGPLDYDSGSQASGWYQNMAVVPDLNNDTYPDIVIGDYESTGNGKVNIYYGHSDPAEILTRDYIITGSATSDFGDAVCYAGDVNNDGYGDFMIGDSVSETVWFFSGSASGVTAVDETDAFMSITNSGTMFGLWMEGGVDINKDGADDVLIFEQNRLLYLPGRLGMTPGQND